jgi:1-acyl-sn-glycerol-3-phosphate acyltransferase
MPHTIFTTPVLAKGMAFFSKWLLMALGWKLEGSMPEGVHQSVVIAAPHTSNWDFPYTLLAAFALNMRIHWIGKHQLFRFPFGFVMRWLGGIAVNRESSNNTVDHCVTLLQSASADLHIVIPPEGTRSKVHYWKTGFYYVALGAKVPVIPGYLDFGQKRVGLGPPFVLKGDIEADMQQIKDFYANFSGKNPQQFVLD